MIQIHAQKSVAFKADNEAPQPQWIHKQEYSILCHERFWQSVPAKAIVHVIEDATKSAY